MMRTLRPQGPMDGGNICLIRAPIMPLLDVHTESRILFKPFKSPLDGHMPGRSIDSLKKTLGCRVRLTSIYTSKRQFKSPPLLEQAIEEEGNFDPLILFTPENGRTDQRQIEVDPILTRWLREHQRLGVKFVFDCLMGLKDFSGNGCILADDMGLGKTLQSITILWTLLKQGIEGKPTVAKAVVVCPASLINNWASEIDKWLKGKCPCTAVADSCKEKTIAKFMGFRYDRNSLVLIASYETFRAYVDKLEGVPVELIICDEAHRLKNDRTKTALAIANMKARKRLLLSGTPIQNDLDEFYSLVSMCNPDVLGDANHFRKKFANPILIGREPNAAPEQQCLASERLSELSNLTNQFILRRTNSLLAKVLPPKIIMLKGLDPGDSAEIFSIQNAVDSLIYLASTVVLFYGKIINVFCRLSPLQRSVYSNFLESQGCEKLLQDETKSGISGKVLSSIQGLMKLCNHPSLIRSQTQILPGSEECQVLLNELEKPINNGGGRFRSCHAELSGKLLFLSRLLKHIRKNTNDRIVLISNYTQTLDLFDRLCKEKGYPVVRLDGSTSIKRRHAMVTDFNNLESRSFVFLLSSKAGGCGINLIGANRLVLFDPDWNPANDKQALARVWRDGQKKICYIYRLFSTGTIEEKIYQRQICKDGLSSMIVTEGENQLKDSLSADAIKDLFLLKDQTLCDTHDMLKCSRCVLEQKKRHCKSLDHPKSAEASDEVVLKQSIPQLGDEFDEEDLLTWAHHSDLSTLEDSALKSTNLIASEEDEENPLADRLENFKVNGASDDGMFQCPVSFVMSCRIDFSNMKQDFPLQESTAAGGANLAQALGSGHADKPKPGAMVSNLKKDNFSDSEEGESLIGELASDPEETDEASSVSSQSDLSDSEE